MKNHYNLVNDEFIQSKKHANLAAQGGNPLSHKTLPIQHRRATMPLQVQLLHRFQDHWQTPSL